MSGEETFAAAKAGDSDAMGRLIEENSGLIWSVVKRFFGRGTDADDLYQLGSLGFVKAVRGYDESFGTQFSTYAVPKISGEIRRFLRDDGSVKVSRTVKEKAQLIRRARHRLEQSLGREPAISEISAETGFPPEEIALCETAVAPSDSLQRESGDGGLTLENVLCDRDAEQRLIEEVSLREAIGELPEREKKVILLRYYRDLTQSRAAELLGISQVQVSRIEKRAVDLLREKLA